jgi:hypothetical protein
MTEVKRPPNIAGMALRFQTLCRAAPYTADKSWRCACRARDSAPGKAKLRMLSGTRTRDPIVVGGTVDPVLTNLTVALLNLVGRPLKDDLAVLETTLALV